MRFSIPIIATLGGLFAETALANFDLWSYSCAVGGQGGSDWDGTKAVRSNTPGQQLCFEGTDFRRGWAGSGTEWVVENPCATSTNTNNLIGKPNGPGVWNLYVEGQEGTQIGTCFSDIGNVNPLNVCHASLAACSYYLNAYCATTYCA